MTKEVLKLARQLLWRYRHETPIGNQPHMICQEADEAFEHIDEALKQPEFGLKPRCFADFQPNHEHDRKCQWCAIETECKTGMAQPEQEPVAYCNGMPAYEGPLSKTQRKEPEQEEYLSKAYRLANELRCHLAIAPEPQRTWVGLEPEEIRKTNHHMVDGAYHYSFKQGAEWAEETLKERNT